jgi:DNA topoisomerase VI subunit B
MTEEAAQINLTPAGPNHRTVFTTSRELEYFTEKELALQIGHERRYWPLALLKEILDNAFDACETAGVLPEIEVVLGDDYFSVRDNGPGLPESTLMLSLKYDIRVSDKNHHVGPTRGQLGNALKCVWAAPFVASGDRRLGVVVVEVRGMRYTITVKVDPIAQKPDPAFRREPCDPKNGTFFKVYWPSLAGLPVLLEKRRFLD